MRLLPSIIAPAQLNAMSALAYRAPPGAIVEVGVFGGGSAEVLYSVALEQNRELHLFDTFTGTPNYTEGLDRHRVNEEFVSPGAKDRISAILPLAHLHVGVYPETHPKDMLPVAFIHCDCDQYLSYRAVIDHMWPHVVPGGMMLFDDYPYLAGAKRAVEETWALAELKLCFQRYYVVKPRVEAQAGV